jgi:predicted secreted protein
MDVRTGAFSLFPRYDRSGKITGWQGSAELVLEGRDFARISGTAGRIQGLTIQGVNFSLSRQARQALEADVQARAVAEFRNKATELAKQFGFTTYTLREVHIGTADQMQPPRPRMMAMEAKMASSVDMTVPAEAGKAVVGVTVSGSVVLGR